MTVTVLERWLDKHGLAEHYSCGVRWIEKRLREGMPSEMIAGKRKFRVSETDPWLERAGHKKADAA